MHSPDRSSRSRLSPDRSSRSRLSPDRSSRNSPRRRRSPERPVRRSSTSIDRLSRGSSLSRRDRSSSRELLDNHSRRGSKGRTPSSERFDGRGVDVRINSIGIYGYIAIIFLTPIKKISSVWFDFWLLRFI